MKKHIKSDYPKKEKGVTPPRHRTLFPKAKTNDVLDLMVATLWPWRRHEYPGIMRLRAWLLGMSKPESAAVYTKTKVKLPAARARIAADKLRAKSAELLAMAETLESYAKTRPAVFGGRPEQLKAQGKARFTDISAP